MNTDLSLSEVDSTELTRRLSTLVANERVSLVELLRHLAEFDARMLYAGLGHPSLWDYLTERLRMSNGTAYRRCVAARLLRRYPVIADFIADGRLSLKRLAMIGDLLTSQNHHDLLVRASQGSEKDVARLVATIAPKPDVKDSLRKVPDRSATAMGEVGAALAPVALPAPAATTPARSMGQAKEAQEPATSTVEVTVSEHMIAAPDRTRARTQVEMVPTSATSYALKARVTGAFAEEFERVKDALSHKFPDGDFEDILRECFRITLEVIERKRLGRERTGSTETPRKAVESANAAPSAQATKRSRHIPKATQRAVWKRDEGKCAFVSADGKRCNSTHLLQLHHIDPFARGGPPTIENLSLRCSTHNRYEALLDLGPELMARHLPAARSIDASTLLPRWKCELRAHVCRGGRVDEDHPAKE